MLQGSSRSREVWASSKARVGSKSLDSLKNSSRFASPEARRGSNAWTGSNARMRRGSSDELKWSSSGAMRFQNIHTYQNKRLILETIAQDCQNLAPWATKLGRARKLARDRKLGQAKKGRRAFELARANSCTSCLLPRPCFLNPGICGKEETEKIPAFWSSMILISPVVYVRYRCRSTTCYLRSPNQEPQKPHKISVEPKIHANHCKKHSNQFLSIDLSSLSIVLSYIH